MNNNYIIAIYSINNNDIGKKALSPFIILILIEQKKESFY